MASRLFRPILNQKARTASRIVAILYFIAVSALLVVATLDPFGNLTAIPSAILTLPWSITLYFLPKSVGLMTLVVVVGSAVNAIALDVVVKRMVMRFHWRFASGLFLVVTCMIGAVAWFWNTTDVDFRVRIINGDPKLGVWVATNDSGLRFLTGNETVSRGLNPVASNAMTECGYNDVDDGLVCFSQPTRALVEDRKFLLSGGRLVHPYSANSYDMERDGAIEVEKIRVTDGPHRNLEGWIQSRDVKRLLTLFSL